MLHDPVHLDEPDQVDAADRDGRRDRGALHAVAGGERRREPDQDGDRQRVVEQVEPGAADHDQDEPDAAGGRVDQLADQQDAQRGLAALVAGAERPQRVGRGHAQHDHHGDGRGQRPAGRALEQRVQLLAVSAGVEVGGERREQQVERRQEQQHDLGEPAGGRVRVDLAPAGRRPRAPTGRPRRGPARAAPTAHGARRTAARRGRGRGRPARRPSRRRPAATSAMRPARPAATRRRTTRPPRRSRRPARWPRPRSRSTPAAGRSSRPRASGTSA